MSGFFLKPDATLDDYIANVAPLFGGFLSILGVSEVRKSQFYSIVYELMMMMMDVFLMCR